MKTETKVPVGKGALQIVLIRIDRSDATVTLVRSDGKEAALPLPTAAREPSIIARITWAPSLPALYFETTVAIRSSPSFRSNMISRQVAAVRHDLDQNHWTTLAHTIHASRKVRPPEREAAQHLITQALGRKIILPMSGAHMSETCK
jgi:hypothetical protein